MTAWVCFPHGCFFQVEQGHGFFFSGISVHCGSFKCTKNGNVYIYQWLVAPPGFVLMKCFLKGRQTESFVLWMILIYLIYLIVPFTVLLDLDRLIYRYSSLWWLWGPALLAINTRLLGNSSFWAAMFVHL